MKYFGKLKVGYKEVDILFLSSDSLLKLSLDKRVLTVSSQIKNRVILVSDIMLDKFLDEPIVDEGSKTRQKIITVLSEKEFKHLILEHLADSIEDVVILDFANKKLIVQGIHFKDCCLAFFPTDYFKVLETDAMSSTEVCNKVVFARPWKEHWINVYDLPNKFKTELENWWYTDVKERNEKQNDVKKVLAKAMGMADELEAVSYFRKRGRSIGEAVGKTQNVNWLGTDLKLEHFIDVDGELVAAVDHEHDIFLFREASIEECASAIAPLYQQMDYIMWQGFREGYWDHMGRKAIDVLKFFDGEVIYAIMGNYNIEKAGDIRREGKYHEALDCIDNAIYIYEKLSSSNRKASERYILKTFLVKGDIYLSMDKYLEANSEYERAIKRLEKLVDKGISEYEFPLCSGLINCSISNAFLGNRMEAEKQLNYAKEVALKLLKTDKDMGNHLLSVIEQNLQAPPFKK